MSLTVNHSPTKYFFARNRNYVEVETDNYTYSQNIGTKAVCYFVNLQNAVINKVLVINWGATTLTYTFKAVTNIGAREIAINSTLSPSEYVAEVANILYGDAALSNYFRIIANDNALFFEALSAGTAFNLGGSSSNVASVGFYAGAATDNIQNIIRPNYKIQLTLFGEQTGGGGWNEIVSVSKEPFDNKVKCDFSKFIDNYLEYEFPVFGLYIAQQCESLIKRFYLKIEEVYGYPQAIVAATVLPSLIMANTTDTLPYYSLKAGFDEISARLLPDTQQTFYFTNKAFLTRQNRVKIISSRQYEFLYFLFPTTLAGNAIIRVTQKLKNGSVLVGDVWATAAINQYDVYRWQINGPGSVFDQVPDIYEMQVFVKNNISGAPISEVFTYVKDYEYHQEEIYFYFANSDAGIDSLRCFGTAEFNSDFETETAQRSIIIGGDELDGNEEVISTKKINRGQVFSGWVPKSQLTYIEELLLSKKSFMYGNDYGQGDIKIPITILNKTLQKHKTKQNLWGFIIEYREAICRLSISFFMLIASVGRL